MFRLLFRLPAEKDHKASAVVMVTYSQNFLRKILHSLLTICGSYSIEMKVVISGAIKK